MNEKKALKTYYVGYRGSKKVIPVKAYSPEQASFKYIIGTGARHKTIKATKVLKHKPASKPIKKAYSSYYRYKN